MLVEAKFWAGLTANQPLGYLRLLPPTASVLLFVAPSRRTDTLWSELVRRAAEFAPPGAETSPRDTLRSQQFGAHQVALTTWRDLLSQMLIAVDAAGDAATAADVRQPMALCDRMDVDAFLPLLPEELSSTIGHRITQFGHLAGDLVAMLVDKGLASVKGTRSTGGNGWFGRYFVFRGHGSLVHFSAVQWANWGDSPLWLQIKGPDWRPSAAVSSALSKAGIPFRPSESGAQVPLFLPASVERDAVIAAAFSQLESVWACLPETQDLEVPPPPDDETEG